MEYGGVPGLNFYPEDLYLLPDGFWPDSVYFDRKAGELVLSTGRSVLVDVPAVSGEPVKQVWIEERLVKRLAFDDSHVEADGTVVLESLQGFLTIRATSEWLLTVWINPRKDDIAGFYPIKFEVVVRPGTKVLPEGRQPGLDARQAALTCKCDKTGCGTGCTKEQCEDIKTCSGGCGSCALTAFPLPGPEPVDP